MEDFKCINARINFNELFHERLVKFWQRRKKWEVDSASKLREQSGFTVSWKYCLNLCSLRRLKGAGCEEVCTNLFETSSAWPVFKVGVSSVPLKVSCRKRLLRGKQDYQGQILVNCSWHRWTFLWVGQCVLGKIPPRGAFRGTLSLLRSLSDSSMDFYIYIRQNN